jgi:hypothetical protein
MGKKPTTTRASGITSTIVLAQKANPLLRGSVNVYKAIPANALQPHADLDYGPDVPDALDDGTILKANLDTTLDVHVAQWDQAQELDIVWLLVDGARSGDPAGVPVKDEPDPIVLTMQKADLDLLNEGPHTIAFEWGDGIGESYFSTVFPILVDRTPPGGTTLPIIRFDLKYEQNGVTLAQIVADGNMLNGLIASYDEQLSGDKITTFIQAVPGGIVTPGPVIPVGDTISAHGVPFTLAQLLAAKAEGTVEFWYEVRDKAGNLKTADKATLRMLVNDAPDQLAAVRIPLFIDDNLVNEGDARTPITVQIPQFGHGKVGDALWLNIGSVFIEVTPALAASDLPADPTKPDPTVTVREVLVPYAFLAALQPRPGGEVNPVFDFDAWYEVRRAVGSFTFATPSPVLPVHADLTLAGGEDPDPETPEDERLKLPSVIHSGLGAVANTIPIGYTPPVIATIPHDSNDTPAVEIFQTGDTVQLFRLDADGTTEIKIGPESTATELTDLKITIPVAEVVPGIWQFFYRVGRDLADGQVNEALSGQQEVEVKDPSTQPGGPNKLPEAIFRESTVNAQGRLVLAYTRASNGTILRIYQYLNMKERDRIELFWQGNDSLYGTGADIDDAKLTPKHDVTATDLLPKDDRLDDDPNRPVDPVMKVFVDFEVTYDDIKKIKPPGGGAGTEAYGSAWVYYTVTANLGAGDDNNTSETDRNELVTHKPLVISARPPTKP